MHRDILQKTTSYAFMAQKILLQFCEEPWILITFHTKLNKIKQKAAKIAPINTTTQQP